MSKSKEHFRIPTLENGTVDMFHLFGIIYLVNHLLPIGFGGVLSKLKAL
jgi:hypothetical protein